MKAFSKPSKHVGMELPIDVDILALLEGLLGISNLLIEEVVTLSSLWCQKGKERSVEVWWVVTLNLFTYGMFLHLDFSLS